MSDQNKDGLENFFRKGAENYDIDFRESDWKALEARLDEEMPVMSPWQAFLKKLWLILPLLIAVPAVWYFTSVNRHEKSPVSHEKTTFSEKGDKAMPIEGDKGDATLFKEQSAIPHQKASTPESGAKRVISHEKNAISTHVPGNRGIDKNTRSLQNQSEGTGRNANKTAPQKDVLIPSGTIAAGTSSDNVTPVTGKVNDGNSLNDNSEDINKTGYAVLESGAMVHENIMNYSLPFLSPLPPGSVLTTDGRNIAPAFVDEKEIAANAVVRKSQKRKVFFAVGVAYSPDLSTVGLKNFTSPGSRWKVLGELHLPGRFAVTTGIVWVQNKYTATKGEYVTPVNLSPDLVDAKCEMIDIPLNLRYDIIASQRHRAFVSGGASTYLVLSQYYDFFFDDPKPGLPDEWQSDETVNYPFSIINISLGYEYRIGRRSALQIEPFIKIPITGIGWGSVDLNTLGVYLSYKFMPGAKY